MLIRHKLQNISNIRKKASDPVSKLRPTIHHQNPFPTPHFSLQCFDPLIHRQSRMMIGLRVIWLPTTMTTPQTRRHQPQPQPFGLMELFIKVSVITCVS